MRVLRRIPIPKSSQPPAVIDDVDDCDCPACLAELDPRQMLDRMLAVTAELGASDDPVVAELAGALLVSVGARPGEPLDTAEEALVAFYIPEFEARGTAQALAVLLAIQSVTHDRARKAAAVAADRLIDAGVTPPVWAAELDAPLTVSGCLRLTDSVYGSMLACVFERAGRAHAVTIGVAEVGGGVATEVTLLAPEDLPGVLSLVRLGARNMGLRLTKTALSPAEFRWHVEKVLDARAAHDRQLPAEELYNQAVAGEGPGYQALATLLRVRLAALPAPEMPVAKRRKPAARQGKGTNRVYQLKVALRGTKPPIWRRVEVPADLTLAELHDVIQAAFGWLGAHLYAFDTFLGEYGPQADAELDQRPAESVRLAQVAPEVGSRLSYTYDFGDDWQHEIVVETVSGRDPDATYPRCTGGRRAAPPDDCGGVWGYQELVAAIDDSAHPEHASALERLGLDFDPATFDADAVNATLAKL